MTTCVRAFIYSGLGLCGVSMKILPYIQNFTTKKTTVICKSVDKISISMTVMPDHDDNEFS